MPDQRDLPAGDGLTSGPDPHHPAQRFARAILGGGGGLGLLQMLVEEFPDLRRADCFYGIALAASDLQLALLAAEAELDTERRTNARLRTEIERLRQGRAA